MGTRSLRRRKLVTAATAAMLAATVFQPAGCTVMVDQALLDEFAGLVGSLADGWRRPRHGPFGGMPGGDCGDDCHESGEDDQEESQP